MAMMIGIGVVISPILRIEGMCPMAHLINIVCAVMLGPLEAFTCAFKYGSGQGQGGNTHYYHGAGSG